MSRAIGRSVPLFLAIFLGITAPFGIFGCGKSPNAEELFFYRTEEIEATAELNVGDSASTLRYSGKGADCQVEFISPLEINGFKLILSGETGTVTIGDLTASAPDRLCIIPKIMREIFTMSPESVTAIEAVSHPHEPSSRATKISAENVTVTLNAEGYPISAEGVINGIPFTAKISNFTVIRGEEN